MKREGAASQKKTVKKNTREQKAYLTKRILISAAKRGFKKAAEETMEVMGYNVIAKDGWVVKKYADGRIEKISRIDLENSRDELRLD